MRCEEASIAGGANMFIVERPGFKLTETFYYVLIVLLIITGSPGLFLMLTMHVDFNSSRKVESRPGASKETNGRYTYQGTAGATGDAGSEAKLASPDPPSGYS